MDTAGTVDLERHRQDFLANPYPILAELRRQGPVHRVVLPDYGEAWLVVGYEAAKIALSHGGLTKDWRTAPSRWRKWFAGDPDAEAPAFGRHMLFSDPPDHTRLRKLVAKAFSPSRIAVLSGRIEELTTELIDAFPADGAVDLIEALAFPLPMSAICELFGVDALDHDKFREWTSAVVNPHGEDTSGAAGELARYLDGLVERKRAEPADDLFGALVAATDDDGGKLSSDELRAMAFLLLGAGHETTLTLIANGALALLSHPDQLSQLRADPALIDSAIEEMLRYEGPAKNATWRFAADPVEICGVVIPGDSEVLVSLASGSRDNQRFERPDDFNIRREAGGHLAFSHGIHYCPGANLARLEAKIVFQQLLSRLPGLRLDIDPAELTWRPGYLMRGFSSLPVRY